MLPCQRSGPILREYSSRDSKRRRHPRYRLRRSRPYLPTDITTHDASFADDVPRSQHLRTDSRRWFKCVSPILRRACIEAKMLKLYCCLSLVNNHAISEFS
jgi:hypothetical protein